MAWTTPEEVRKELGLKMEDVSDEDLAYYIEKAQRNLLSDIAVYRFEEAMIGSIDGVNCTFQTRYSPIADSNFDGVVNPQDIIVAKWGDINNFSTRSTIQVSSIDPVFGIVVLASPPEATVQAVTCTYYYLPNPKITFEHLRRLSSILAAYYYVRSEMLLVPDSWAHGAYRFTKGTPAEELLNEYYRELSKVRGREHLKESHTEVRYVRGEQP